jgi:hypothetical protein
MWTLFLILIVFFVLRMAMGRKDPARTGLRDEEDRLDWKQNH